MKRLLLVPLLLTTLFGCSQKEKVLEIPVLPTVEEIRSECKTKLSKDEKYLLNMKNNNEYYMNRDFIRCMDYEILFKKRLCDSRVFPERYFVNAERRDGFNRDFRKLVLDLEITNYPSTTLNFAPIEGSLTDIVTGEKYKLKEIIQNYTNYEKGEKTVVLDDYEQKWIPLKICKSWAEEDFEK